MADERCPDRFLHRIVPPSRRRCRQKHRQRVDIQAAAALRRNDHGNRRTPGGGTRHDRRQGRRLRRRQIRREQLDLTVGMRERRAHRIGGRQVRGNGFKAGQTTRRRVHQQPRRRRTEGKGMPDCRVVVCFIRSAEPVADIPAEVVIAGTCLFGRPEGQRDRHDEPRGRGHCGCREIRVRRDRNRILRNKRLTRTVKRKTDRAQTRVKQQCR